jgi:transcriptional regulator with XRE-family HTH domain
MSIIADHLTNSEVIDVIGQRLRQRRLERNLLVDDLASHAGVNRKTILALESGEDIRLSSLIKILRSLDMLGLLEAAVPDSLPGGAAVLRSGQARIRARGTSPKGHRNG